MGEGGAALILETLEHAAARGAEPVAEMVGYGSTADAHHITQPGPGGRGRGARDEQGAGAGADAAGPKSATSTRTALPRRLNDKYETMAVKAVFGEEAYRIPISSTKSMTGHLLGASGALEAAVTVFALSKWAIPPTINLQTPDPDCDLDYTPHMPRRGRIRSAMSNSFGFGGHNASLVFQEFEE